jgi:hypothetical protein
MTRLLYYWPVFGKNGISRDMNIIFLPQVAWKHVRGNQKYGDLANHEWMGYRKSRKLLREKLGSEAAIGISKELVTLPTCFFETDQPVL